MGKMKNKPKTTKVMLECSTCGENTIAYEGRVIWNSESQTYDIVGHLDDASCTVCEISSINAKE